MNSDSDDSDDEDAYSRSLLSFFLSSQLPLYNCANPYPNPNPNRLGFV